MQVLMHIYVHPSIGFSPWEMLSSLLMKQSEAMNSPVSRM